MKLPVAEIDGERVILHLGGSELKKMKLIDDMATCQDVYCGGSFAPKQGTSFRNTIAIAPLKSFLKLKKTVQLIGNNKLSEAYKQIDGMERYAMTKYQLYEKKQERTLDRIARIAPSKQLKKLDETLNKNFMFGIADERPGSRNSQILVRKRKQRVKAKKRAGVGGTYMKRLKLASDSLKNTDPESSFGTVLNMESYLAFKDISKVSEISKRRKRRRKDGKGFSKTESEAIRDKAKDALQSIMPRWTPREQEKIRFARLTEAEIGRKKEEFFRRIEDVPKTMTVADLLKQPRLKRGFRPSKVIEKVDPNVQRIRSRRKSFDPYLFSTSSGNAIPLPGQNKEVQKDYSRRELAKNNTIYKLVNTDEEDMKIDDHIALLGSYAELTRLSYLRDDDEKMVDKRREYNKQIEKLKRRRMGLQRNWITVAGLTKRCEQPDVGLPKNSPMMPLIPHLDKRVIKLQKSPVVQRSADFFFNILRKIDEREEETSADPNCTDNTAPAAFGFKPVPVKPKKKSYWGTLRKKRSTITSIAEFQKLLQLPTMTPPEKCADNAARKEKRHMNEILRKNTRVNPPLFKSAVTLSLSNRQNSVSSHNLHSQSTPNFPDKEQTPSPCRRSSASDSELGFKMKIFLSGLCSSVEPNIPPVVS